MTTKTKIKKTEKTKKTKKILLVVFTIFVSVALGAALYLHLTLKRSVPITAGVVWVVGPNNPIEITFDSLGIPQIWAESASDAYFGLGYQHAADRLFQMELARRVSQGRLSEILGSVALKVDLRQRKMGHTKMAEEALTKISLESKIRLEAYARGVNAYVNSDRGLPFEFLLLQTDFEKWTALDCLTLFSFQSWYSDAIQNRDDLFIEIADELGEERARTLLLPYPDWAPYTVPERKTLGAVESLFQPDNQPTNQTPAILSSRAIPQNSQSGDNVSYLEELRNRIARQILKNDGWGFAMSAASNAWVVSPDKSTSGKALLAGDPHLDVTRLPQFWYAVGFHVTDESVDVFGITAPGLPFVVMGHNRACAWSFTAAGIDLTDYFREKLNPKNKLEALGPEGWEIMQATEVVINIADTDNDLIDTVFVTRNGPLVLENDSTETYYSLRWTGFETDLGESVEAAFSLATTAEFSSFRRTVTSLGSLDANWMYADTVGDIGFQLGSPIPIRPDGAENLALNGWEDNQSWSGYYPLDQTPWALNPQQGWLASCNNKQDQTNLDYELHGSFFADRILRATEYFNLGSSFSAGDMKGLQLERTDRYFQRWALELAPLLEEVGETERALSLRNWDGAATLESKETALIAEFLLQLKQLTFEDELGENSQRLKRLWVDQIYHSADTFWFDNIETIDSIETPEIIAREALRNALKAVGDKSWGEIHSLTMAHPMSIVPGISSYLKLTRGPWKRAGTGGTLNASYYRDTKSGEFQTLAAPSWRMVVDMADPEVAHISLPAGNSGNPLSEHFFDFFQLWSEGKYWSVTLDSAITYAQAKSKLTLSPLSK